MIISVSRGDPGYLDLAFPYDERVIAIVKRIPGREYRKRNKTWRIPLEPDTIEVLRKLSPAGWSVFMLPELRRDLDEIRKSQFHAAHVAMKGDARTDFQFLTQPYAHQRAGFVYLQDLGSAGLTWEMGTGKTKTAIDWCESLADDWYLNPHEGSFRVLVLCPRSVRNTVWVPEIKRHAGHEDIVVPEGIGARRAKQVATARYTIMNVETMQGGAMAEAISRTRWNVVIADESTKFKNPGAARTKRLHKLRSDHRLIMTGTPMANAPQDLWSQLQFVKPGLFGSWWAFRERYLATDWFGNVTGLKAGMEKEFSDKVATVCYRVLKRDVLDLPPKVYMDRLVGVSPTQKAAYDTMVTELRMAIPDSSDQVFAASVLTQLLRLTQITAGMIGERDNYVWDETNPKLAELDHLLNDELRNEQVVVFGLYQRELEELAHRYGSGAIIYGPTPDRIRTMYVDEFQKGDRRLLFCQIRTGGIGLNLTAAQTAIYFTRSWSLEEYLQSQDRLHRIGQKGSVSIIHLITEGSIDLDIAKALNKKQITADLITGDAFKSLRASVLGPA